MIAVDTSVVVAALSPWHEDHDVAARACRDDAWLPAHCLVESYSTLTRMPEPLRVAAAVAQEALAQQWGSRLLAPSADLYPDLLARCARHRVVGGGTYDALVALTAASHEATLVSLDRRAERTYRLLGIDYRLL